MLRLIQSAAIAAMLIAFIGQVGARGQAVSPQAPVPQTSAPPTTAPTAQWIFSTDGSIDRFDRNSAWVELAARNTNAAVQTKPVTYLGVSLEPPTEPLRAQLQLQDNVGLLVTWVDDQGPAREVLAKHDIITRVDDQIVINPDQFEALVRMHKPGDALDIRLVRNARPMQVSVKLSEKSATATAFAAWTDVRGDFTTVDRGGAIYIFNSTTGQSVASPTTQPAKAATIDRWVEAKLQDFKPDAPPDRATVARRLYLDVTGLPASEAQIKAFIDDKSPDAYEKLVQELLKNRPAVIQQTQYVLSDKVVTPAPRNVVMTDGAYRLKFDAEGGPLLTIMDKKTGEITFHGPLQKPDEWKALPQAARTELDAWLRTMDEWHQAVTQDPNQPTEGKPK